MNAATAAAVAGLDVLEEYEGTGEDRRLAGLVKKWRIANKMDALKELREHYHQDGGPDGPDFLFPVYRPKEVTPDGDSSE